MLPFQELGLAVYNNTSGALLDYIDLRGDTYGTTSYAPAIAQRNPEMGGISPYMMVPDTLTLTISSNTPGGLLKAHEKLARTLESAKTWWDGESPDFRICLRAKVINSANRWEAIITGPSDGEAAVSMPADWVLSEGIFNIPGVVVKFNRGGLWERISPTEAAAVSGATDSGSVATMLFAETIDQLSSYQLGVSVQVNGNTFPSTSWLLTTGVLTDIQTIEAESRVGGGGIAAAAAELASNAQYVRIAPGVVGWGSGGNWNPLPGGPLTTPGVAAIFMLANFQGANWQSYLQFNNSAAVGGIVTTPIVDIPFDAAMTYRVVPMGFVTVPEGGFISMNIELYSDAVGGANRVDIDRFVIIRITEETSILQLPPFTAVTTLGQQVSFWVDPALRTKREPMVYYNTPLDLQKNRPAIGNPVPVATGNQTYATILETSAASFKRPTIGAPTVPLSQVFQATRQIGTLIPY